MTSEQLAIRLPSDGLGAWRIEQRDLRVTNSLVGFEDETFDAVLCDPPYGLSHDGKARTWDDVDAMPRSKRGKGFMGKAWDDAVPGPTFWREVLRVLKPGGYAVAFGGTRTYHRLASAMEDAGFYIRDQIDWLYGTGFPKSKSQLKPMHEPICLAMKAGDLVSELNIDAGRLHATGRWPGNVVLDEEAAAAVDAQSGERPSTLTGRADPSKRHGAAADPDMIRASMFGNERAVSGVYADSGGASRFFYVAKSSRGEREAGLREAVVGSLQGGGPGASDPVSKRFTKRARNVHPTVKPISLARQLSALVLPQEGRGTRKILVPFSGSGSEMIGALLAGWDDVTGLEQSAEYIEIAMARVAHAVRNHAGGLGG